MAEYIERGALLDKLKERDLCLCVTELDIKEAPAADVAPVVHGRWIIGDGDDDFDVKCPVCGWSDVFGVAGIDAVKAIAEEMHFCPNCGARMDKEADCE